MSTTARLFMLDTNVISQLMKDASGPQQQRVAAQLHGARGASLCISVIVQCELLFGLRRKSNPRLLQRFEQAMQMIEVKSLDPVVAEHYAELRQMLEAAGTPIGPNDTLIAAHALALDATLVTADAEFRRVPGLRVENWLQAI